MSEHDVFLALPSKCCDSAFAGPHRSEFKALLDELRRNEVDVYCPLEEVGWNATAYVDDPVVTMKSRLDQISNSRHVVAFPQVGEHTSSGVTMLIASTFERDIPLTIVLCGEDAFASEWQLAGLCGLSKQEGGDCAIIFYTGSVAHCWNKLRNRVCAERESRKLQVGSSSDCPWGEQYQWYWDNRLNFFSKWEDPDGNQLIDCDLTGLYTVKPELISRDIAEHLGGNTVLDAFAGVGGVSIALAKAGKSVIAVEKDKKRVDMLKSNLSLYGVSDSVEVVNGDIFDVYEQYNFDSVYLDPPWGGPSYKSRDSFHMRHFKVGGVTKLRRLVGYCLNNNKDIAFTVPNNFDFPEFSTFCRKYAEGRGAGSSVSHNMSLRWGKLNDRVLFLTVFLDTTRRVAK
ncbi:MAG TPA: hypothetical protein DDW52_19745 [Planctomycetaceae bacterium]|nr:hypothetical protein [Planctomycetaceae bacterium]